MQKHSITLQEKIILLKKQKNAIVLAHYYQEPGIQDVADFVGDSLGLSQQAATTNADIIVFAGVHFMAETAKILNPIKKVLLPDLNAGCSLADSCPPAEFKKFIDLYPDHIVVSYINCSAEIKSMSNLVCTSANAVQVINSIPENREIIFAPDRNLGHYLIKQTGRRMLLWDGACIVHEAFSLDKVQVLRSKYPDAKLITHPESTTELLDISDFIGSTSAMIEFIQKDSGSTYIIATEAGILHEMKKKVLQKTLIPAPAFENNTCACSECPYMKLNTLEKLYQCLLDESPAIAVEEHTLQRALEPLKKMLQISSTKKNPLKQC